MPKTEKTEDVREDEITYYIFVKKGCRHFSPQYLSAGTTTVKWIFPIPDAAHAPLLLKPPIL